MLASTLSSPVASDLASAPTYTSAAPNTPLDIFGATDAYAGWAAHTYVQDTTDTAPDLSGHGYDIVQADAEHKPELITGPRGKRGWRFTRLSATDGPRLAGSFPLSIGADWAMWFVFAGPGTGGALTNARPFVLGGATANHISSISNYRVDSGLYYSQNSFPGSAPSPFRISSLIPIASTDVHIMGWFRHPTTGFWTTWSDGSYGPASTNGGTLTQAVTTANLGHSVGSVPFDGVIYEAWVTLRPTAQQVIDMYLWASREYGIL